MPSKPACWCAPILWAIAVAAAAHAETAVRITDLRPGAFSGVPGLDAAVFADKLYFAGTGDGGFLDLWVYDGILPATKVPGSDELQPTYLTVWQGALHFLGGPTGDRELWRYDGVNPPVEVLDLLDPGSGSPAFLTPFGSELCFRATPSAAVGGELVCWDGATAPDVYDLRAGVAGSTPDALTVLGDRLFFSALVDDTGREPWSHENFLTPELVGDLRAGAASSSPSSFVQHGPLIHLRASDSGGQGRVWVDDGVDPPAMVSTTFDVEGGLASWGGRLLVGGYEEDGPQGEGPTGLYVQRATGFTSTPWAGGPLPSINGFLAHRNALYFRATPSTNESDLFRHCGNGSVERVTDQFADLSFVDSRPVLFQGRLFFAVDDDVFGRELWAIDPMTAVFCDGFEDGHDDDWTASVP